MTCLDEYLQQFCIYVHVCITIAGMIGGVWINKLCILVISMIFLFLWIPPSVIQAEDTIRFEVIDGDTLVVSGTGEVGSVVDFDRKGKKIKLSNIKKLIFKEGVTKI